MLKLLALISWYILLETFSKSKFSSSAVSTLSCAFPVKTRQSDGYLEN